MPRDTETAKLTKELLEEHEKSLKANQDSGHNWVNKVVQDEQLHLLHSRLGMTELNQRSSSQAATGRDARTHQESERQNSDILALFEPRQESFQESPMERFLTPDGCSDPPFFARPALARNGIPFGDAQSMEVRKMSAKDNMDKVEKMTSQDSEK
ncbi:conserved hypothetical protein [Paecilomyces variotii No. 5]|uniref:Uncharacterized protein n=1 Tax=Byssochlamys spectabilis (strain No. 5 / NBRC 109023) TaxID=1356009 RepID=V5G5C2_BYSSN|nr:conserved hypothetical protein [Paecilomyces variotii No. 5]